MPLPQQTDESLDCPACGCADVRELSRSDRSGRRHADNEVIEVQSTRTTCRCNHCGKGWTQTTPWSVVEQPPVPTPVDPPADPPAAKYQKTGCPECGSAKTKITSTRRWGRYHKCNACGHAFKTVERVMTKTP